MSEGAVAFCVVVWTTLASPVLAANTFFSTPTTGMDCADVEVVTCPTGACSSRPCLRKSSDMVAWGTDPGMCVGHLTLCKFQFFNRATGWMVSVPVPPCTSECLPP